MTHYFIRILIVLSLHCTVFSSLADDFILPFTPSVDITIDGQFSIDEWQYAQKTQINNVIRPFDNTPAPVQTHVYFVEDGKTLYVAFIAYDPDPDKIRARFVDRDSHWGDDLVGVKLDTFNDGRLAYQFFVNPHGIQSDGIQNEMTGNESDSWNTIWQSAGSINDEGYVVEIAIPLNTMNFAESQSAQTWGIEFVRFYPRDVTYRITHVIYDRDNACDLCQMGKISGFANAKKSNDLTVIPTLVAGAAQSRELTPRNDWQSDSNVEVGVDVNWGITPETLLQATFNPDFSQVESDVTQISVNNTFALFLPEKRPFFVENADYFTSRYNLIYTRNINAPTAGIKLTGRQGQHSFGTFLTDDDSTQFLVPGNLSSSVVELDEKSQNMALRYRYDASNDLAIGTVITARQSNNYDNHVYAGDVKWTPTEADNIRFQWVGSRTQYPDTLYREFCDNQCEADSDLNEQVLRTLYDRAFTGSAWRADYNRDTEDYNIRVTHSQNDKDFRGDLGFVSRVDRQYSVVGGGYNWRNETSWWQRIRLSGDVDIHHNDAGELLEREVEAYLSLNANYDTFISFGGLKRKRVGLRQDPSLLSIDNNATKFDEHQWRLVIETRPSSRLSLFQRFVVGDQIDFANNRVGERKISESALDFQVNEHLELQADYEYRTLDADNATVFSAGTALFRANYQFDARQFLRLTVNYTNIKRNTNNYIDDVDAQSKERSVQLLYSYKVNPLTRFFVGYSDAGYADDDVTRVTLNEQSLFMKFSYAYAL